MAELLKTEHDSRILIHPWYQIIKHRLVVLSTDEIKLIPTVVVAPDETLTKSLKAEGLLTPIIVDEQNLLVDGAKRLNYFKTICNELMVYKARSVDEENFLKQLNAQCFRLHPNIFDWGFMFEKDMRKYTNKVLPLLQEGIQSALVN